MAASSTPKVSVVIATFNRAPCLARAIESVQAQTLTDVEILVCDDCSTDGTSEVVAQLQRKDARIRYLRAEKNGGPARARDMGFRAANAPYLTTLDSDDVYLSKRKLEAELALVTAAPVGKIQLGYSRQVLLDEMCQPLMFQSTKPLGDGDLFYSILTRSCDVPRDFIFPRELYLDVGGYDFELPVYEDWDLKLRLATRAQFALTAEDGTGYVQHASGLSRIPKSEHQFWLNHLFRRYVQVLPPQVQASARDLFGEFMAASNLVSYTHPPSVLSERQLLGEGLIFIFSMPRSGSTLLQRILSGHSQIYTRSEPWLLLHPLHARKNDVGITMPYNQGLAHLGVDDFISDLPGTDENYLFWLRQCYAGLYRDIANNKGALWYLDKTPRYHLIADQIMQLFPRAKFILLWRHPMAILRSMYEDVRFDVRRMPHWKVDLGDGIAKLAKVKATGRCVEIYYEQLVADPGAQVARLMQQLDIPMEDRMLSVLAGEGKSSWRFGDKKKAWTTKGVEEGSVELWRQTLRTDSDFAALASAMVRTKKAVFTKLPYDFSNIDQTFRPGVTPGYEYLFAGTDLAMQDTTFVVRVADRLASVGPIPYAIGRAAWRVYRGLTPQ